MRVFAISDLHVDFPENNAWVERLSLADYTEDVLLVAGDVSDSLVLVGECIAALSRRFRHVLFLPGNHELWVVREKAAADSMTKFDQVPAVARDSGASTRRLHMPGLCITLGSAAVDCQIRQLGACLHVYGHSHLNRQVVRDGVIYVNAPLGYPRERAISARRLLHIDPLLPTTV